MFKGFWNISKSYYFKCNENSFIKTMLRLITDKTHKWHLETQLNGLVDESVTWQNSYSRKTYFCNITKHKLGLLSVGHLLHRSNRLLKRFLMLKGWSKNYNCFTYPNGSMWLPRTASSITLKSEKAWAKSKSWLPAQVSDNFYSSAHKLARFRLNSACVSPIF